MTCEHVHLSGQCVDICSPDGVVHRRVLPCPTCGTRRRFVVQSWVWYPSHLTCVACGDTWSEGGRLPRPFARGWRSEAMRRARALWGEAMPRRDAMAALQAMAIAEVIPE